MKIVVDGDPGYNASTTRKAVELLLDEHGKQEGTLVMEQTMGVPIGCGFGASAAAAISGVYAAAKATGIRLAKAKLAYYAHVAEILQQTGLGTVSVTYDRIGAGAITKAGGPGISEFLNVRYPAQTRIVTASLAPFRKSDALSAPQTVNRINDLGNRALRNLVTSPTLETLGIEGERFSESLGLMNPNVKKLARLAKASGASYASQNMIGHAIHALVTADIAETVAAILRASSLKPQVAIFEIGRQRAGILS